MEVQFQYSWVIVDVVEHVRLFVRMWRKNNIVDNMFQCLYVGFNNISRSGISPYRSSFGIDILFYGRCLPNLLIILSGIKVGVVMESMLNHQVVELQL